MAKKYVVEVIMSTCVAIEVEANDEAEAQAIALEEADPHMMVDDWDYEIDCVYRDGDDDDEDEEEEEEW